MIHTDTKKFKQLFGPLWYTGFIELNERGFRMDPATAVIVYIFIATFGIFIFSLIMFCRLQKKRHYKCSNCGYNFKPGGITAFFSKRENVTDRLLNCPRCGVKCFMKNIDDGRDDIQEHTQQDDVQQDNSENDNGQK